MALQSGWFRCALMLSVSWHAVGAPQEAEPWTEARIVERFLEQSPQARELRARVGLAEAEARARTVYPNPSASYSREGAGYNEFFEVSQVLPVNGRLRYLRDAGSAAVAVSEAGKEAALWTLRNELRVAFQRMVAAQERVRVLEGEAGELERLLQVLRVREQEGEGSRYDRLRAEREAFELRTDVTAASSQVAAARARLTAFLPEGTRIGSVLGELAVGVEIPGTPALKQRALGTRADYRVELRNLARYQIEEQAARRLRVPEPQISAGIKRADVTSGKGPDPFANTVHTGLVFSLTVPLPVFNSGRYEVARYLAEQEQARSRAAVLERQMSAEIEGAREVLEIRMGALKTYRDRLETAGPELGRITRVAYDEGEAGILDLLDSLRVNRAANLRLLDLQVAAKEALIELERAVGEELAGTGGRP